MTTKLEIQTVLRAAAQLVSQGWCRGVRAQRKRPYPSDSPPYCSYSMQECDPCASDAEQWCADGALIRAVYGDNKKWRSDGTTRGYDRLDAARDALCVHLVAHELITADDKRVCRREHVVWNDRHCHTGGDLARILRAVADEMEAKP